MGEELQSQEDGQPSAAAAAAPAASGSAPHPFEVEVASFRQNPSSHFGSKELDVENLGPGEHWSHRELKSAVAAG